MLDIAPAEVNFKFNVNQNENENKNATGEDTYAWAREARGRFAPPRFAPLAQAPPLAFLFSFSF